MGKILLKNIILNGRASDMLVDDGIIAKIAPSGSLCCSDEEAEVNTLRLKRFGWPFHAERITARYSLP